MNPVAKAVIWTDGLGTFQARCLHCSWKGTWRRKEETAVKDGKRHPTHQLDDGYDAAYSAWEDIQNGMVGAPKSPNRT